MMRKELRQDHFSQKYEKLYLLPLQDKFLKKKSLQYDIDRLESEQRPHNQSPLFANLICYPEEYLWILISICFTYIFGSKAKKLEVNYFIFGLGIQYGYNVLPDIQLHKIPWF